MHPTLFDRELLPECEAAGAENAFCPHWCFPREREIALRLK